MASSKRGPSVLVTDSRGRPPPRGPPPRPGPGGGGGGPSRMPSMRFMTVDNVLQYASEIPSGQPRVPPGARPSRAAARLGIHGGGGGGGGLPTIVSNRTGQQNLPSRTTKVSEKLVLLPEAPDDPDEDEAPSDDETAQLAAIRRMAEEEEARPLKDEELDVLRKRGGIRGRSYAERLPKVKRGDKVARVTAYCTAQAYKTKATAEFLRKKHEAKTKLYDDCLYAVYHLPTLGGFDGYRLRSRPFLKSPGTGKTVLDLHIEESERSDEHEGYFDEYYVGPQDGGSSNDGNGGLTHPTTGPGDEPGMPAPRPRGDLEADVGPINLLAPDIKNFAEMFLFSYGVVVFWNFTERQEKDILADLTFANNERGVSLVTRPLDQSDIETEEFHFEYSNRVKRPRVFNDMITLLPRSDHMVKLTISHAIAQSTKLSFFEERMSQTMVNTQHIPKRLALTGQLNMTRKEIVKILGRLFKSRVDINLSSNILDVPNFFWDSEPTLHPLYVAIREYLEIDPRTKVLNERCRVFLDLAEILSDSVADAKMSAITWTIIILICFSILITVGEVSLRFGMLEKSKGGGGGGGGPGHGGEDGDLKLASRKGGVKLELRSLGLVNEDVTAEDLRLWARALTEREKGAICGAEYVGRTFAGL